MKLKKSPVKPKTEDPAGVTILAAEEHDENLDPEEFEPEIEPEPRRRGRPPKPEAFEYIRRLVAGDFNGPEAHQIYLWRVDPQTARKKNTPDYLDCLNEPIDQQRIKERFGGGVFQMRILKGDQMIYDRQETTFTIAGPAKLQSFELPLNGGAQSSTGSSTAGPSQNDQMMGMLERLIEDLKTQRDHAAQEGKSIDIRDALKKSLETMGDASKAAIDIVKAQAGADNKGENSILTTLLNRLLDNLGGEKKENPLESKMLDKLMDRAFGEKQNDPWELIEKMIDRIDRIRGNSGSSSGKAAKSDWVDVGMKFVEKLDVVPEILDKGLRSLELAWRLKSAAPDNGATQQPQIPQRPVLVPRVAQNPAAAPPLESIPTAPGELSPEQVKQAEAMMLEIYAARAKEIMVQALLDGPAPGDESNTGAEVAAIAISVMHPPYAMLLCQQLESAMTGNQQQMAAFREDRILGQLFTNPKVSLPMVMAFAKDFCETVHERAEEEAARGNKIPNPPPPATEKGESA